MRTITCTVGSLESTLGKVFQLEESATVLLTKQGRNYRLDVHCRNDWLFDREFKLEEPWSFAPVLS